MAGFNEEIPTAFFCTFLVQKLSLCTTTAPCKNQRYQKSGKQETKYVCISFKRFLDLKKKDISNLGSSKQD